MMNIANLGWHAIIARMIQRRIRNQLVDLLAVNPAVVLLGPRQVGKTTLALEIAETRPSLYIDLESPSAQGKIADPESYLSEHEDELVIFDEVHRMPDLFQTLRGLIESGRRRGKSLGGSCCWGRPQSNS